MDHNYQFDESYAVKRRKIETLASDKGFGDGDPNLVNKLTSWAIEESIGNSSFSNLLEIIKPHCAQQVQREDGKYAEQTDLRNISVLKRSQKSLLGSREEGELIEITFRPHDIYCETETLKCSQNGSSEIVKLASSDPDHLTFEKRRIELKLDTILKENAEIKKLLTSLNQYLPKQRFSMVDSPGDIALPIKTPEEFLDVEKSLASDDFYKSFVEKLSLCGGFSTKDVIHRIMKTLLLHELSLNVTWSGKVTGKLGFQGSLISKAVIDSVRRNSETSSASDAECEKEIKSWLRNASDRNGGRMKRRQVINCLPFA